MYSADERQKLFYKPEGTWFLNYLDTKRKCGREENTCYIRTERSMVGRRFGTWRMRRSRGGVEEGKYPLRQRKEGANHTLLKCFETGNWRMDFLCKRWLVINEEMAYKNNKL
jgi:hypothetical protein